MMMIDHNYIIIRPRRFRSAARPIAITLPWTICRSVCTVHCGKTADRIRMRFSVVGRTGPGTRQIVWFAIGPREGVLFGTIGPRHCNQWGLYGISVRQRRNAALFPNYFEQTCYYSDNDKFMLCYVMLCYVMLCYAMLCYAMLCYVMLCYVMLCYAMLCYVMLCYACLLYTSDAADE